MTTTEYPTLDDETPFHRHMWYGDPGTGKTTNIARAANHGRVIYIDADQNGLKAKALRSHGINTANIEPHRDTSFDAMVKLHSELNERLLAGEEIFAVAWDTVTKAADGQLDTISVASAAKDQRKARRTGKDPDEVKDQFDIWQDDYGTLAAQIRKLLRLYIQLPCHLLIGAHQRRDVDKESGRVTISPAVSPAVGKDLAGYMDVIIHCRVEEFEDEEEFSGLCRKRGRFIAKDRFRALPGNLVDPTFDRVVAYIGGDLDKETDPLQTLARRRRQRAAKMAEEKAKEAKETEGESPDETVQAEQEGS